MARRLYCSGDIMSAPSLTELLTELQSKGVPLTDEQQQYLREAEEQDRSVPWSHLYPEGKEGHTEAAECPCSPFKVDILEYPGVVVQRIMNHSNLREAEVEDSSVLEILETQSPHS